MPRINGSTTFDAAAFFANAGPGRRTVAVDEKEAFFYQGDRAGSVFYLQAGRVRLSVVSPGGKEAIITFLSAGEFVGEESLAPVMGVRLATATAVDPCTAVEIDREVMIRVMHEERALSDLYLKFLLARSMRSQADLIDQLFNSSEKRLARILLLMAEFGEQGEPESIHSSHHPGNTSRDGRHHPLPRQLLHESLSQARALLITPAASRCTGPCSMCCCSINCRSTTRRGPS